LFFEIVKSVWSKATLQWLSERWRWHMWGSMPSGHVALTKLAARLTDPACLAPIPSSIIQSTSHTISLFAMLLYCCRYFDNNEVRPIYSYTNNILNRYMGIILRTAVPADKYTAIQ
jgi:hypothetical protein